MARDDNLFGDLPGVMSNQRCTCFDDCSRGSVVCVEHCSRGRSEVRLEVHDMIYVSACKTIDGLPVITHGEEMSLVCSNKCIHKAGHGRRGVLELVHKDMTELRE